MGVAKEFLVLESGIVDGRETRKERLQGVEDG
jgi:hypothetical protein